jgi:hypothetical protein
MDNTKHSFSIQVSVFLRSKESKEFHLTAYHREILRVIANYLDMPYGSCFAKQINLAEECGMSVRQFRDSCNYLIDRNLIKRVKCYKLYHYELSTLTGILCR